MKFSLLMLSAILGITLSEPQPQFFRGFGRGIRNFFGGGNRFRPNSVRSNSGRSCSSGQPNHDFEGKRYLVSWRTGCTQFGQPQGAAYCRASGMRPISLDTVSKENHFKSLVSSERQKYFWTGGTVNHRNPLSSSTITWPSGAETSSNSWSHTGGAGRPQPDNRERNEACLGVLNNFYNDGVKFHDISCHHRKPIICEPRN